MSLKGTRPVGVAVQIFFLKNEIMAHWIPCMMNFRSSQVFVRHLFLQHLSASLAVHINIAGHFFFIVLIVELFSPYKAIEVLPQLMSAPHVMLGSHLQLQRLCL